MRKYQSILMIAIMAISLTGCGGSTPQAGKKTSTVKSVDDVLEEQAGKDLADGETFGDENQEVLKDSSNEIGDKETAGSSDGTGGNAAKDSGLSAEAGSAPGTDGTLEDTSSDTDAMAQVNQNLEDAASQAEDGAANAEGIDVDLTKLSSTLIYSAVYNMMADPDKYLGKKIRMSGNTAVYHYETDGNDYYACIIKDATACCAQGIEFQLKDRAYPEVDTEITVSGIFSSYDIEGAVFYTLKNAVLE